MWNFVRGEFVLVVEHEVIPIQFSFQPLPEDLAPREFVLKNSSSTQENHSFALETFPNPLTSLRIRALLSAPFSVKSRRLTVKVRLTHWTRRQSVTKFAGSCCRLGLARKNNKGKRIGGEVGQIFDLFEIFNNFEIGHFIVRPRDEIVWIELEWMQISCS